MDEFHKKQWSVEINNELINMPNPSEESSHWSKTFIYRIPSSVTDLNKRAYTPQLTSFGPYHHGSINLQPMEKHKHRAFLHFLKRSKKTLESFVDALNPVFEDLKGAYDQLEEISNDEFLKLMIVDGCFMLEILRASSETHQITTDHSGDYANNDPIFSHQAKVYVMPHLKRDMLMLENQLPMLVLEKLFSVQNDEMLNMGEDLTKLILNFFYCPTIPVKEFHVFNNSLHILDIYRKTLLFFEDPRSNNLVSKMGNIKPFNQGGDEMIRSATDLDEAGITIRRSRTRSPKDISFNHGVLRLPPMVVDDATESCYLNLMAFERFHVMAGNEVTAYIFFMSGIIDSDRDVRLLHERGILQNALGSYKDVAKLVNYLSKDVTLDPESSLDEVHRKVSAYCQQPWNRWRANLMHTYFADDPWVGISVIAAFYLSTLQTIYTVLGFYKKTP